jgi:hypothetical protein
MLRCLGIQQRADQRIQAFELDIVASVSCDFARLVPKLIQPTLAADQ